ncbi:N-acetyltransferase B complex non catalytic subunit-domain-containing protein [Coniochaeta sp. 2T2.1]|nr:N-acetyltransferase B complex non catalytic subunit-domain-containing protein [Coniochaeta sp. 2T2.1]
MSYSRHYRPALKNSVDVQLQTTFSDGNWQVAARLADKRAKSLKDPYYEVVKICAESQLDSPTEKYGVLFAVDELVRKGTVVRDLESLELYEWACADVMQDVKYSESFGVLRLRWVKANPRSTAGVSCLQQCLLHWDLVNAQQIAAILDKSQANNNDRRLMFWSITLTYLLSISSQCPEGKQKLYSLLSLKQLERAAEITAASPADNQTDRGLRTEEELYLYYRVLATHGSKEDLLKQLMHPELGAMKQFDQGKKHLFLQALDVFESQQKWDEAYDSCLKALSRKDEDGSPSYLAADWRVWKTFITAASKKPNPKPAFEEVQKTLQAFVSTKAKVAQMYKKNIAMAVLETSFRIPKALLGSSTADEKLTPRLTQLCLFLDQNYDRLSAFDDLKEYVTELSFEEAKHFVEGMIPKLAEDSGSLKGILIKILVLKFRYLLTTCPQTLTEVPSVKDGLLQALPYRCRFCSNPASSPCEECLKSIISSAVATHQKIRADPNHLKAIPNLDKDPRLDLSMLIGLSLLKLSGLQKSATNPSQPRLQDIKAPHFLQAVLVLDTQLRETPDDTGLRLLLVQLYILLGCASYAFQLWTPLDVKRTIQDALSPLFFDRISTLSPGLFQGSRPLTDPLRSYYKSTLRDQCPIRVWDAFTSGSYTSIVDMAEYDKRLRRSCTLVMTVTEERHAARALGGKLQVETDEDVLLAKTSDHTELVNATDYGSFTNMESKHSAPIQDLVRFGPGLSSARSHLAIHTARLHDVISYRPPKDYKPAKAQMVAAKEHLYNIETLGRVHNSSAPMMHNKATASHLTSAEYAVYMTTVLLSGILISSLSLPRSSDPLPADIATYISTLKTDLSTIRTEFLCGPPADSGQTELFAYVTNMHTLSALRDVALSIRHSAAFLSAWHEREATRDRSSASGCHKDILVEMKALDGLAAKALEDVKARLRMLKGRLGEGGWLDRLLEWTFGSEEQEQADEIAKAVADVTGGRSAAEEWAGKVLESWIDNVKGWGNVKME